MVAPPFRAQRSPGTVVRSSTAHKAVRSGALWGYVFGAVVASSAISYTRIYKTQAERDHLAAVFGANRASAALFGPALQLQTVAGFTVFKSFMTLMVIGAVWGLLTSTRLLRGEEDAGRWELFLAGQTTRRRAAAQALGGLAAGAATLWLITAIISVLTGQYSSVGIAPGPCSTSPSLKSPPRSCSWLSVPSPASWLPPGGGLPLTPAGSSASLMPSGWSPTAASGAGWLIWASPLGWVEQLRPLTSPQPLALLPIAVFSALAGTFAVRLAAARDAGAGLVPDRAHAKPRTGLLFGQLGLTIRLVRPAAAGWAFALAVTGLVLGLIAKAAGGTISGSSVQTVFSRLGAPGTGAAAFLGVSFLIVAVLVAFTAAGQVTAARGEEAEGRLDHLLVRPVARSSWLGGRAFTAVVVIVVCSLLAGFTTWLGATAEDAGVNLGTLVNAGLNVAAPALCLWGIGTLCFGWWPRATSYSVYGALAWSLLVELLGGIGADSRWLLDASLFHQMAAAPAVAPDWTTNGIMIAIGALCGLLGALTLKLRDIQGE